MHLQEIFIKNLKYYRKKAGMTQNELTLAIDKGYNYINGIEQGRSFPSPDMIEKISNTLNIRPAQLFDENSNPESIIDFDREKFISEITERIHSKIKEDLQKSISNAIKSSIY